MVWNVSMSNVTALWLLLPICHDFSVSVLLRRPTVARRKSLSVFKLGRCEHWLGTQWEACILPSVKSARVGSLHTCKALPLQGWSLGDLQTVSSKLPGDETVLCPSFWSKRDHSHWDHNTSPQRAEVWILSLHIPVPDLLNELDHPNKEKDPL